MVASTVYSWRSGLPQKVKKLAFTGANLVPDSTAVYEDAAELVQPMYEKARKNKDKNSGKTT
jgi:hypothetical protein